MIPGSAPTGSLALAAAPDDGWSPVDGQPTTWTGQTEAMNPWTTVEP